VITFQLISASGIKFDGQAYEVLVPTRDGTIALFEDHMPLVSAGAPGLVSIRKKAEDSDSSMESFAVGGGIIQIDGKTARFISDDITTSDDASEQEAEAAMERAQELLKRAGSQIEINEAKRLMAHSSAKLHVAKIKKRRH